MQALTDLTAPDLAAVNSPQGRAWMAAVPSLLHDLARQWNLITAGDLFWHGCNAVVFPVRQGSRPLALKLAWPVDQTGRRGGRTDRMAGAGDRRTGRRRRAARSPAPGAPGRPVAGALAEALLPEPVRPPEL